MANKNTPVVSEILRRLERGEISTVRAFSLLNQTSTNPDSTNKTTPESGDSQNLDELLTELDSLIGLSQIKELIHEYRAFIEIQRRRRHVGLKAEPLMMHMIFKGNPGTGKTTVARILSKIFKEIGILEKGHMIEAERADLVGEYIGHTAQKTRKMLQKAQGGILFIDEAYSLARGGERDFGKEAIDTMVKSLEDMKDSLVVVLAGYRDEMDDFMATNPGLRSRFPIQLDFEDYSLEELIAIGEKLAQDREYHFSPDAKTFLYRFLSTQLQKGTLQKGNARTVRNIIERTIRIQAVRLVNQERYRKEELMQLQRCDLENGVEKCLDV